METIFVKITNFDVKQPIQSIKAIRALTDKGLKESKDIFDAYKLTGNIDTFPTTPHDFSNFIDLAKDAVEYVIIDPTKAQSLDEILENNSTMEILNKLLIKHLNRHDYAHVAILNDTLFKFSFGPNYTELIVKKD